MLIIIPTGVHVDTHRGLLSQVISTAQVCSVSAERFRRRSSRLLFNKPKKKKKTQRDGSKTKHFLKKKIHSHCARAEEKNKIRGAQVVNSPRTRKHCSVVGRSAVSCFTTISSTNFQYIDNSTHGQMIYSD